MSGSKIPKPSKIDHSNIIGPYLENVSSDEQALREHMRRIDRDEKQPI
jgi:hypothetical protein